MTGLSELNVQKAPFKMTFIRRNKNPSYILSKEPFGEMADPVIVPTREPVMVPAREPVIVPVREPVIVPTLELLAPVLEPVIVPA